jgi:hypothetical protein
VANVARTSRSVVMPSAGWFILTHLSARSVRALPAFSPGSGGLLSVLGEVAGVAVATLVPGPLTARAAMARLAALAARLCGPFTVVGKVSGTVLAADVTGAGSLFPIFGEIARITGMTFFCHDFLLPPLCKARVLHPVRGERAASDRVLFKYCVTRAVIFRIIVRLLQLVRTFRLFKWRPPRYQVRRSGASPLVQRHFKHL